MPTHSRSYLILGAGGHARVTADLIRALGGHLVGLIEQREDLLGQLVEPGGGRVVATQAELFELLTTRQALPQGAESAVVAIGHNLVRLELSLRLRDRLAEALIHPSAQVSPSAHIGAGSTVLPGVVVNAAAHVGLAAILNSGAIIEHDCQLGDGVHVSPNATLCGAVTLGDRSWVGAGATILPGVQVGPDAVVGAGATVLRDVPEGVTVVGSPARPLTAK